MKSLTALFCLAPALGAAQFVPMGPIDPNESDYTTIVRGQDGNIAVQSMLVLPSSAALRQAWPGLTGQPAQAAPTKDIQWGRQQAIVVALGDQSEGTSASIRYIRRQNGRWVVMANSNPPFGGGGRRGDRGRSRPWVVVAVDRKVSNPVLAVTRSEPTVILNPGWGGGGWNGGWGYPNYPEGPGPCPYNVFRTGGNCAVASESVFIISTPGLFVGWYNDRLGFRDRPQLPQVDWTSERLVALHAGKLDDSGLVLSVTGVRRTTKGLVVDAKLVRGQGGGSPWALVRLPAGQEPVDLIIERP